MYMISNGFCKVHVIDKQHANGKMEEIDIRVLQKGNYFGEVSAIYDMQRTASVTS